jgi:VanZ family protein
MRDVVIRWGPAVLVMVIIFWLSSIPGKEVGLAMEPVLQHVPKSVVVSSQMAPLKISWLKMGHVVMYACLGLTYLHALRPSGSRAPTLAVLLALVFALSDEFHQSFVPGRSAGLMDVVLDVGAAALAVSIWVLVSHQGRKRKTGVPIVR